MDSPSTSVWSSSPQEKCIRVSRSTATRCLLGAISTELLRDFPSWIRTVFFMPHGRWVFTMYMSRKKRTNIFVFGEVWSYIIISFIVNWYCVYSQARHTMTVILWLQHFCLTIQSRYFLCIKVSLCSSIDRYTEKNSSPIHKATWFVCLKQHVENWIQFFHHAS